MPFYDFKCSECDFVYCERSSYDETGVYEGVICPECGAEKKEKLFNTSISFNFANPVGTDRWNSMTSGHDYRYKHNAPDIAANRQNAEDQSHMGKEPYNPIDDVSSGKHFGEVE